MRRFLTFTAGSAVLLALGLLFSPTVRADTLLPLWYDSSVRSLDRLEFQQKELRRESERLEAEFGRAQQQAASAPDCRSVDCSALSGLDDILGEVNSAARGAWLLATLAERQQDAYAKNLAGGLDFLDAQAGTLRTNLMVWEIGRAVADLAVVTTVAVHTGGAGAIGWAERLTRMAAGIANYSGNKLVDAAAGHQSRAGDRAVSELDGDVSEIREAIARSAAARLTSVGVLQPGNGFRLEVAPRAANLSVAELSGIVTRALIHAVTDPAIETIDRRLAEAISTQSDAIRKLRDAQMVAALQRVNRARIASVRREVEETLSKLAELNHRCSVAVAERSCGGALETSLNRAADRRDAAIAGHQADIAAAANSLDRQRAEWLAAFEATGNTHRALRAARANLAEQEQTERNRARIELLAERAKDQKVRDKYRRQLDALDRSGGVEALEAEVARLESRYENAWQEVTLLEQSIANQTQAKRDLVAAATQGIADAERAYGEAYARATEAFYRCIGDTAPRIVPTAAGDGLAGLRREYPGDLFIDQVVDALAQRMAELHARLRSMRIGVAQRQGGSCTAALPVDQDRGSLNGCWVKGQEGWAHIDTHVWEIRQIGETLSVAGYLTEDYNTAEPNAASSVFRLRGLYQDPYVDLLVEDEASVRHRMRTDMPNADLLTPFSFSLVEPLNADLGFQLKAKRDPHLKPADGRGRVRVLYGQAWTFFPAPGLDAEDLQIRPAMAHFGRNGIALFRRHSPAVRSVAAMSADFKQRLAGIPWGEPLNLEVRAEDPCAFVVDDLVIEVNFGLAEESAWATHLVLLRETEAASGIFRSTEPVPQPAIFARLNPGVAVPNADPGAETGFEVSFRFRTNVKAPESRVPIVDYRQLPEPASGDASSHYLSASIYGSDILSLVPWEELDEPDPNNVLLSEHFARHTQKVRDFVSLELSHLEASVTQEISWSRHEDHIARLRAELAVIRAQQSEYTAFVRSHPLESVPRDEWRAAYLAEAALLQSIAEALEGLNRTHHFSIEAYAVKNFRSFAHYVIGLDIQ